MKLTLLFTLCVMGISFQSLNEQFNQFSNNMRSHIKIYSNFLENESKHVMISAKSNFQYFFAYMRSLIRKLFDKTKSTLKFKSKDTEENSSTEPSPEEIEEFYKKLRETLENIKMQKKQAETNESNVEENNEKVEKDTL